MFAQLFSEVQKEVHDTAIKKGWWEEDRNNGELIALIHSELSECLEALRMGNPLSKKILSFTQAEEELADAVIRIMDMAEARGWDVATAILEKMEYNYSRPHKHGKEF